MTKGLKRRPWTSKKPGDSPLDLATGLELCPFTPGPGPHRRSAFYFSIESRSFGSYFEMAVPAG